MTNNTKLAIINFVDGIKKLMTHNMQVYITHIVSEHDYVECDIFNKNKQVYTFKLKYAAGLPYHYRYIISINGGRLEPLKQPSDFFRCITNKL